VECEEGETKTFAAFTSMSRLEEKAESLLTFDKSGKKSGTMIHGKDLFGYDLSGYSFFGPGEKKVILEPFQQLIVSKVDKKDVVMIEMRGKKDTKFLLERKIPKTFDVKSPESEILQEALDHCRRAERWKNGGEMKEAEKEWKEGQKMFLEAAKTGSQIGALNVGVGYLFGIGVEKDFKKGIDWLMKARKVEEDEVWMIRELSNREFFFREGVDMSDFFADEEGTNALKEMQKVFPSVIGKMPSGKPQSPHRRKWSFISFTERTSPKVPKEEPTIDFSSIPGYKEVKLGLEKDKKGNHEEAMKLYAMAGDLGNKAAFLNMGNCFMFGKGVEEDKRKGIEMFMKCNVIDDDDLDWIRKLSNDMFVCDVKLDLSAMEIGDSEMTCIGEAFRVNSTITELNLQSNAIGNVGALSIEEALKYNSTLTRIELANNQIRDSGVFSIGEGLKNNSTLTTLSLRANKIGDSGAYSLGKALRMNSTLKEVWLYE